jgi:hypothetical protein
MHVKLCQLFKGDRFRAAAVAAVRGGARRYRFSGGMCSIRLVWEAASAVVQERCTRFAEGGWCSVETPGRHAVAGRMGRGAKPPPQLGQTLWSLVSTQSAQKVHSYEQMRASVDAGGKSRSQYSQLGRSWSAIVGAFGAQAGEARKPNAQKFSGSFLQKIPAYTSRP